MCRRGYIKTLTGLLVVSPVEHCGIIYFMSKKVDVKPHFRGGKPVAGHNRTIQGSQKLVAAGTAESSGVIEGLQELAFEEKENLVSVNVLKGVTYNNNQFKSDELRRNTRFESCIFQDCNFTDTNLSGIEFVDCTFDNCILSGADLSDASFDGCKFEAVDFENEIDRVTWKNTRFSDCAFNKGTFKTIYLTNGIFDGCKFNEFGVWGQTKIYDTVFRDSHFKELRLVYSDLTDSIFEECEITDGWFNKIGKFVLSQSGASMTIDEASAANFMFRGGKLAGCTFEASWIAGSSMQGVAWDDCEFKKCDLRNTTFEKVTGKGAYFHNTYLQGASFDTVSLSEVTFYQPELQNTSWRDTRFEDCHFIGGLEEKVHRGANYEPAYRQYSLDEALKASGVSSKQFEFLVLSGVIEVRDNDTMNVVISGFDSAKHHVAPWVFANLKYLASTVP